MSRRPPIRNALPVRDFGRRLVGWLPAPARRSDGWRIVSIAGAPVVLMVGRCMPAERDAALPRIERCYLLDTPTIAALADCPHFVRAAPPARALARVLEVAR